MSEPRQIGLAKLEPVETVVAVLRDVLTQAERGEVRQVAVAYVAKGEAVGLEYGVDGNVATATLIGAVARLQAFLISTGDDE